MSNRRSHHPMTRRRIYRAPHHQLRERRLDATGDERCWPSDQIAASTIEAALDFEAPTAVGVRYRGRGG